MLDTTGKHLEVKNYERQPYAVDLYRTFCSVRYKSDTHVCRNELRILHFVCVLLRFNLYLIGYSLILIAYLRKYAAYLFLCLDDQCFVLNSFLLKRNSVLL